MKKQMLLKLTCDPYVVVSVLVGIVLMILSLRFGVPSPCHAVVDERILNMPFIYGLLAVATLPSFFAGAMLAQWTNYDWAVPLIYFVQVVLYAVLGIILRQIHNLIRRILRITRSGSRII